LHLRFCGDGIMFVLAFHCSPIIAVVTADGKALILAEISLSCKEMRPAIHAFVRIPMV